MPHIDEWIRKIWGIYPMEYYSVMRKSKTILLFSGKWKELVSSY
jgi:hypothetical protein